MINISTLTFNYIGFRCSIWGLLHAQIQSRIRFGCVGSFPVTRARMIRISHRWIIIVIHSGCIVFRRFVICSVVFIIAECGGRTRLHVYRRKTWEGQQWILNIRLEKKFTRILSGNIIFRLNPKIVILREKRVWNLALEFSRKFQKGWKCGRKIMTKLRNH